MHASEIVELLDRVVAAIGERLSHLDDWGLAGTRPGQYRSDLAADEIAVELLSAAGLSVLSEESGLHNGSSLLAVLDPVDGSTNASRSLPWYATSICVLDDEGAYVSVVVNQATGRRYSAVRGQGATRDGKPIEPSSKERLNDSLVALSGFPYAHLGWRQYRVLGAAALDLCAVADGSIDAYLDCVDSSHGPWDYLGGMLVCQEAGATVGEVRGRDLVVRGHRDRRSPVAGATPTLCDELLTSFHRAVENMARLAKPSDEAR